MISKEAVLGLILPALLVMEPVRGPFKHLFAPNALLRRLFEARSGVPKMAFRQAKGKGSQDSGRQGSETRKPESKLTVGKPSVSRGVVRFLLYFTAAPGETVGTIHAQVTAPEDSWKFLNVEPAAGSGMKVSAKQQRRDDSQKGKDQAGQATLVLSFSAGGHAIRDGLIGTLRFSLPEPTEKTSGKTSDKDLELKSPVARILGTSPPETEQILTAPSGNSFPLPSEPSPNPAVSCFFFSH